MQIDLNNEMFQLAVQMVNCSHRNIFLTGKAGTGKTTFLKYIREHCPKQIAVVAPTGVAALNAGGVTIHSFFQLPLSPFIPEAKAMMSDHKNEIVNRHSLLSRLRFTKEKKKVIQELELLIIDEISMVRCDLLDEIDIVLRHVRRRHSEQFGGVQVLFVGDMYQLPPVVREEEWSLLSSFYESPYFFDSRVIKEFPPAYFEFEKIYRQSETQFIGLLNQIRNNEMNHEGESLLESTFQRGMQLQKAEGYIILSSHNYKSDAINAEELKKLPGRVISYRAEISGEFSDKSYPADEWLYLKESAQVMFIKNDSDKSKRYFNGKIGIVTKIDEEDIWVQCKDEPDTIKVKKETWENIRYTLNKNSNKLEEDVLGSFVQFPLRLAWAITIHKSQGLTFDKAIIDAGEAFAPGQVYVALSRCSNLDGLILKSRIKSRALLCDERIVRFSQNKSSFDWLNEELTEASKNYQMDICLHLFDFTQLLQLCKGLMSYVAEHKKSFNEDVFSWSEELIKSVSGLNEVAEKFHPQIMSLFGEAMPVEKNTVLQERTKAAAAYFKEHIGPVMKHILGSPAITDSRPYALEYNESLKEIYKQLSLRKHLLDGLSGKFNIEAYHRRKNDFIIPTFPVNAYAGSVAHIKTESSHPELYQQLRKLRDSICSKKDLPIYFVASSRTLNEMTGYLPQTLEELQKISGFGHAKTEMYGQQFLEIIKQYSIEHNLSSRISEKKPKRQRKSDNSKPSDTKAETYKLYKEGKTVSEIADFRKLTVQTIEGHLSYYVQKGDVHIEDLLSKDKITLIEPALKGFAGGSITPIKAKLGDAISFGEIRLVIAWSLFKNNTTRQYLQ